MNKALLIFAKQPLPGKVKTRLSPPFSLQEAANIYCCMLSDTLAKLADLPGIEKFLFFEPSCGAADYFRRNFPEIKSFPQQGDGLGDRLEKAFETVFALGFESAAAIGTDSPDLPWRSSKNPIRLLEEGHCGCRVWSGNGWRLLPGGFSRAVSRTFSRNSLEHKRCAGRGARRQQLLSVCGSRIYRIWHDMDTVQDLKRFLAGGDSACAPLTLRFLREKGI